MRLSFRIKHHFFSAFRELFVHHHSSLEFRARIFALLISANKSATVENFIFVKEFGINIYKGDEERANLLMLSTKELVDKVRQNNGLNTDSLISSIQQELKRVPRYAKKIDLQALEGLLNFTYDQDTIDYQKNIIEFLSTIKEDTLHEKKVQIIKDEEKIESKY
jgi:hypothetical protein